MIGGETATIEEWRPIDGAEKFYSVSNLGRVRSEPLPYKAIGKQRGRILRPSCDTKGYRIFNLCIPHERGKTMKVHRVVARAFLGDPPQGCQVNHKNGDKSDNRVENLEYVTCRQNIHHCWQNGLHGSDHCRGEANSQAKLTEQDVHLIRQLHPALPLKQLAVMFGVTTSSIANVVNHKTWRHVKGVEEHVSSNIRS